MSEDWGSSAWISDAEAWEVVLRDYGDQIKRQVLAAVARGAVLPEDAEGRVTDATIQAVQLLKKHDPSRGNFEHYLAASIRWSLRLRRIGTKTPERRGSTDLEDHEQDPEVIQDWLR